MSVCVPGPGSGTMGVPAEDRPVPAYFNKAGNSGVASYDLGAESISVRFVGGRTYVYTDASCGSRAVGVMRSLARAGRGLATYIARNKPAFAFER